MQKRTDDLFLNENNYLKVISDKGQETLSAIYSEVSSNLIISPDAFYLLKLLIEEGCNEFYLKLKSNCSFSEKKIRESLSELRKYNLIHYSENRYYLFFQKIPKNLKYCNYAN